MTQQQLLSCASVKFQNKRSTLNFVLSNYQFIVFKTVAVCVWSKRIPSGDRICSLFMKLMLHQASLQLNIAQTPLCK
ncbi:unnamed protein product [Chondrus crispus]|uniref:Uncharacterized protein n=1 Tax=Chondrus crispus TaxID=2769 RepID=R7QCI3_CHOCR|nr:unnamed protein product [Chondrus crispus]CDF35175.1 unnamed protein product [Chondrus crispus]|eukprot:XP_005714994.1 unnamed protein product [Chondrus crispus]